VTRLILNAEALNKLAGITRPVELSDEAGRVIGRFFPQVDLSRYEPLDPQVSEEELNRRAASTERTYTTAEVLAHLETL
jgi:hypothetical protein